MPEPPAIRPLVCAYCGAVRPLDGDPCPACGKERWWHKTRDAAEFEERVGEAQAADAARYAPRETRDS